MKLANQFFETARERFCIKINKDVGRPRKEWTNDPIFQEWRFCNVHREDDATTEWFARNIRDPLSKRSLKVSGNSLARLAAFHKIVEATVIFRWFNRIESGEVIQDLLLGEWDSKEARRLLEGIRPVVTGAYIIKGWDGYEKLPGVLKCIDEARPRIYKWCPDEWKTLQEAWTHLQELSYMGPFMAYEVASDLRWTPVLSLAYDILSWANPGPGCRRGLGWVCYGTSDSRPEVPLEPMAELLAMSKEHEVWPNEWPQWEMREVEHWLCEFDKYKRAERGDRLKRRYR